ncbi:hypothetical protein F5879DRAFT_791812, partial [Lentinula edodes]
MKCLYNYRQAVQYVVPEICACCGSADQSYTGCYRPQAEWPSLSVLKVTDPLILAQTPQSRFTYICRALDGLLLDKRGIRSIDVDCSSFEIYFCRECYNSLRRVSMPRLALNNYLYRGELIEGIEDITWVEEMACAIYHTSAHVARIYGSSNAGDSLQLHGNVCAHALDICSVAKKLPWSPADVNDLISIVFVSKAKLKHDDLRKLKPYFVRRSVIRMLLSDLCHRNRLYTGLYTLDNSMLELYPDNDLLPGLQERIVYD